jgi:hypothetical protein
MTKGERTDLPAAQNDQAVLQSIQHDASLEIGREEKDAAFERSDVEG